MKATQRNSLLKLKTQSSTIRQGKASQSEKVVLDRWSCGLRENILGCDVLVEPQNDDPKLYIDTEKKSSANQRH